MKSSLLAAAALAVASFVGASAADAATTQVISGTQRAFLLSSGGGTVGQSFVALDTDLTSFGFQFEQFGGSGNLASPNLAYTFSLLNGAGLSGGTITTRTFTIPTSLAINVPTWIDVDLTGTSVTAGQTYTAVVASGNQRFGILMGPDINIYTGQELSGDAYTDGRAFFASDPYPNCARTGNCDLNFRVTGTTATAAVPEPATWGLLIGGFAFTGGALRRRRAARAFA